MLSPLASYICLSPIRKVDDPYLVIFFPFRGHLYSRVVWYVVHNIIQIHNRVMWDRQYIPWYSSHSDPYSLNVVSPSDDACPPIRKVNAPDLVIFFFRGHLYGKSRGTWFITLLRSVTILCGTNDLHNFFWYSPHLDPYSLNICLPWLCVSTIRKVNDPYLVFFFLPKTPIQ